MRVGADPAGGDGGGTVPRARRGERPGWVAPPLGHGWHAIAHRVRAPGRPLVPPDRDHGYAARRRQRRVLPALPAARRGPSHGSSGDTRSWRALLVSNIAFFGSLLVLYDLTIREFSEPVARRAIVYIAIFPTAFFFFAPYSESLFLLLSLVAFREARLGPLGGCRARGRSGGAHPEPRVSSWRRRWSSWRSSDVADDAPLRPSWSPLAAVFLGPLATWGGGAWRTRDCARADPRTGELATRGRPPRSRRSGTPPSWRSASACVDPELLADRRPRRRRRDRRPSSPVFDGSRSPYLAYALGSLLIPLCYPFPPRPLLSMPRFVAVVFPGVLGPGRCRRAAQAAAHGDRRGVRGRLQPACGAVHELVVHLLNRASRTV